MACRQSALLLLFALLACGPKSAPDPAMKPGAAPSSEAAAAQKSEATAPESPPPAPVVAVGDAAPGFSLPDSAGNSVTLESLLADGPAVLVFYRGDW